MEIKKNNEDQVKIANEQKEICWKDTEEEMKGNCNTIKSQKLWKENYGTFFIFIYIKKIN